MITSHLDATDGRSSVWEEFASCFLKILTSSVADYEDRVSANGQGGSAAIISSNKIPRVFTEGQARESWKVRCRWWLTRHFGKNVYLQDMQYSKLSNELYEIDPLPSNIIQNLDPSGLQCTSHFLYYPCFLCHISKHSIVSTGDRKLLATKAASASHIYGPNFEYVKAAFSSLTNEANNFQLSFLQAHMEKSMRLHENLIALSPSIKLNVYVYVS
ncbi:hypothetical protein BHE74_00011299 [Ensete ventricosum]|nr:hypothetical protein BHE74_00011299 [Ensete ventricosum]